MKKLNLSSILFLFTGFFTVIFSIINRYCLVDKDFKDNFKNLDTSFHSSDLFFFIGLVYIAISFLYRLTKDKYTFKLSETLALTHYFLTILILIELLIAPILETFSKEENLISQYFKFHNHFWNL